VPGKKATAHRATNVIDLVQVLQESLRATGKAKPAKAGGAKRKKKAASQTRAA